MYVTWLAESQRLNIRFLTRLADGAFQEVPSVREELPDERVRLEGGRVIAAQGAVKRLALISRIPQAGKSLRLMPGDFA